MPRQDADVFGYMGVGVHMYVSQTVNGREQTALANYTIVLKSLLMTCLIYFFTDWGWSA